MTQDEIAKAAEIHKQTLRGMIDPEKGDLQLLPLLGVLEVLKVEPEQFFQKSPNKFRKHADAGIHERLQAVLDVPGAKRSVESMISGLEKEWVGDAE